MPKTMNQIKKDYKKQRKLAAEEQYEYLTATFYIRPNHPSYRRIEEMAYGVNAVYNSGLYLYRQALIHHHKWLNYNIVDKTLQEKRNRRELMVYNRPKNAQTTQQTLKLVDQNWKSWIKATKAYKKNPKSFTGRPKMPKYADKGKKHTIIMTNQTAKLKGDKVIIPTLNQLTLKMPIATDKIQQVRIIPRYLSFKVEVVYKTNLEIVYKPDNGRYLSIDPGVNNAFTMVSNVPGIEPVAINGRAIKSLNQFFNKRKAKLTSRSKNVITKRLLRLSQHRALKLDKFAHEASKYIVNFALSHELNTIIIGHTPRQKNKVNLGKRNNQNFVGIPHQKMIEKIIYKANLAGITVILTEESYTSQTSFVDKEQPVYDNANIARRKKGLSPNKRRLGRGLYRTSDVRRINADVNGAYQILKKVVPDAFIEMYQNSIPNGELHPHKWNLSF